MSLISHEFIVTIWFTITNQAQVTFDAGYKSTLPVPFGFNGVNGVKMQNYNHISCNTINENIAVEADTKYIKEFDNLYKMPGGVYQFILKVRKEIFVFKFIKVDR